MIDGAFVRLSKTQISHKHIGVTFLIDSLKMLDWFLSDQEGRATILIVTKVTELELVQLLI